MSAENNNEQTMDEFIESVSDPESRSKILGQSVDPEEVKQEIVTQESDNKEASEADAKQVEESEPQAEQEIPSKRLRVANEKRRAAESRVAELEAQMQQMNDLIEQLMHGQQSEPVEEQQSIIEDDPAYQRQNKQLQEMQAQQMISNYQRDIQLAEMKAEKSMPDLQDAYQHVIDIIAENLADEHGMELEEVKAHAKQQVDTSIFQTYLKNGGNASKPIEQVYKQAKRLGFKAKESGKGSGVNLDAIKRNMESSGSPDIERANIDPSAGVDGLLSKIQSAPKVRGKTDYSAIQAMINKNRNSARA